MQLKLFLKKVFPLSSKIFEQAFTGRQYWACRFQLIKSSYKFSINFRIKVSDHFSMSTWNVGNYHWEEHNCNKWASERLQQLASEIKADGWEFTDIAFSDIQATRAIRKNREIRTFDFTFECKFKHDEMTGKIKFEDVTSDAIESPEDWEYELTFTGDSAKKTAAEKKVIRVAAEKEAIPQFRNAFDIFSKEFKSLPSDLKKD